MTDLTKFLTEAREVGAKATEGPWEGRIRKGVKNASGVQIWHAETSPAFENQAKLDAIFIAFARNHWDEMLDLLERQGKALEVARDSLDYYDRKEYNSLYDNDGSIQRNAERTLAQIETILAGKGEG